MVRTRQNEGRANRSDSDSSGADDDGDGDGDGADVCCHLCPFRYFCSLTEFLLRDTKTSHCVERMMNRPRYLLRTLSSADFHFESV
jgi:hypothetical protein